MQDVETLWADFARPIVTADDYIASLRGRTMKVFLMGQRVPEPVDNPVIYPSINAMAETYRLASERPELGGVKSDIAGVAINRFLHVPTKPDDLVSKHEMQREWVGALALASSAASVSMLSARAIPSRSTSIPSAAPIVTSAFSRS